MLNHIRYEYCSQWVILIHIYILIIQRNAMNQTAIEYSTVFSAVQNEVTAVLTASPSLN
jgi:hypothetical protein